MNYNERAENCAVEYVILHYTGMRTGAEALARLRDPSSEVSAHYLIEEDGKCFPLVDEKYRAWHAGQSFWRGIRDINSCSIGIELVNPGHEFGYRPFPESQIAALEKLLGEIKQRYNLKESAFLGHSDVAPARKTDPGELFPWQRLAQKGFGLWPDNPIASTQSIPELLAQIGYDISEPKAAETAFLRHYRPQRLDAGFDDESRMILACLARMLYPAPFTV